MGSTFSHYSHNADQDRKQAMLPISVETLDDSSQSSTFDRFDQIDRVGKRPKLRKTIGRCVTFDDAKTSIHEIERIDEPSRSQLWFTKKEYRIIKTMNKVIVKSAYFGSFRESKRHTIRGLERYLYHGNLSWPSVLAVTREQERQAALGLPLPEVIAFKYMAASRDAQTVALARGQGDAKYIERHSSWTGWTLMPPVHSRFWRPTVHWQHSGPTMLEILLVISQTGPRYRQFRLLLCLQQIDKN